MAGEVLSLKFWLGDVLPGCIAKLAQRRVRHAFV